MSLFLKVSEEEVKSKAGILNGCCNSEMFNVLAYPGLQCFIRFYPTGNHTQKLLSKCSLHLKYKEKMEKVVAAYDLEVKSAMFIKKQKCVFENSCGYGGPIFVYADLINPSKNFFVNGMLTIEINGTLSIEWPQELAPIQTRNLSNCLWTRNDKDVVFFVDNTEIRVCF